MPQKRTQQNSTPPAADVAPLLASQQNDHTRHSTRKRLHIFCTTVGCASLHDGCAGLVQGSHSRTVAPIHLWTTTLSIMQRVYDSAINVSVSSFRGDAPLREAR